MKKVFFTGHRVSNYDREVFQKFKALLKKLIKEGVTDFYAGGALGWDTANLKIFKKDSSLHYLYRLLLVIT